MSEPVTPPAQPVEAVQFLGRQRGTDRERFTHDDFFRRELRKENGITVTIMLKSLSFLKLLSKLRFVQQALALPGLGHFLCDLFA